MRISGTRDYKNKEKDVMRKLHTSNNYTEGKIKPHHCMRVIL